MPLNLDKYTDQIKEEDNELKKYKKVASHIFVAFITAVLFIFALVIFYIIQNNRYNYDLLKEADSIYEYSALNTVGLIDYCSTSDSVPKKYIYLFEKKFANTMDYADSILVNYYNYKEIGYFKENARRESAMMIEKDFKNIKREYPKITKTEYCKMYESEPEKIVNDRIDFFKTHNPNIYKD